MSMLDFCAVCGGEMPEERHLTCSRDCYTIWFVEKERAKRKGRVNKGLHSPNSKKFPAKLKAMKTSADGRYRRKCEYCDTGFMASNPKTKFCTPQCSILAGSHTVESARRIPSLPKMPWDRD